SGRERTSARAQMVFERPVAGPAAGDDAGKEDRVTAFRGPPDAACGNLRGGGHDQLKRILDRLIGVEEEDVLRTRAYVDRSDAHRSPLIAPHPRASRQTY